MVSSRSSLLSFTAAALFSAALALQSGEAGACPGKDGAPCVCGAACPSMGAGAQGGACPHGAAAGDAGGCAGAQQAAQGAASPGACACAGGGCAEGAAQGAGCAGAAAAPAAAAGGHAESRAVLDPATGELVAPSKDELPEEPAAAGIPRGIPRAVAIPVPGAGVSAPVGPRFRSNAVATIGSDGQPHLDCERDSDPSTELPAK